MLSDEEKKAIKNIKKEFEKKHILPDIANEDLGTLLNLIEKQSKEIEEYKKQLDLDYVDNHFVPIERYNQLEKEIKELKNEVMEKELIIDGMKEDRRIAVEEIQEQYYISKDKIKAKIEEVDKDENASIPDFIEYAKEYATQKLQSLLEKE